MHYTVTRRTIGRVRTSEVRENQASVRGTVGRPPSWFHISSPVFSVAQRTSGYQVTSRSVSVRSPQFSRGRKFKTRMNWHCFDGKLLLRRLCFGARVYFIFGLSRTNEKPCIFGVFTRQSVTHPRRPRGMSWGRETGAKRETAVEGRGREKKGRGEKSCCPFLPPPPPPPYSGG